MGGIKYYHLAKDEKPPDEFCAIRDVGGEPSEYTFYAPESENVKLRELVLDWYELAVGGADSLTDWNHAQADLEQRMRELGIEVDG